MFSRKRLCLLSASCLLLLASVGIAQVSPEEAAKLKTTLTPMGAERAGNANGTIPAWTGGFTNKTGFNNGRRPDPFASDKVAFTITAQNMDKHADKLSDGQKALMKKYPSTYVMNVYQTRRTFANPQYVYDNTFKNATRAKRVNGSTGLHPANVIGGVPFPIPHDGAEVIWNYLLHYRSVTSESVSNNYVIAADGRRSLLGRIYDYDEYPYYLPNMTPEKLGGVFYTMRTNNEAPPIRTGEGVLGLMGFDEASTEEWTYLPGQRRTRKLPNPCCDTPAPQVSGQIAIDDAQVLTGSHMERMNWKLLGKKEMYVAYNSNMAWVPKSDGDRIMPHHLNPKYIRWELHRVWVVEATRKPNFRSQVARSIYYIDEDSWTALMADRWDESGHLWKTNLGVAMAAPDLPSILCHDSANYDLVSGSWATLFMMNEMPYQYRAVPPSKPTDWTPAALAGAGVR